MAVASPPRTFGDWALSIFGALMIAAGLPIAVSGAWLLWLGGSYYYVFAGTGLIASGALLMMRRPEGGWLYAALFVATLIWAVWDIGIAGWPLAQRVLAPTVLALILLCFLPVLRRWAVLHDRPIFRPTTAFLIVAGIVLAAFGVEFGATKIFPRKSPSIAQPEQSSTSRQMMSPHSSAAHTSPMSVSGRGSADHAMAVPCL